MLVNGVEINIDLIRGNSKNDIEAIKMVRKLTGATLKDAEDAVKKGKESNVSNITLDSEFYDKLKQLPGFDSWGTRKEIKYLRTILYNDEEVFAIASGIMEHKTWLVTCTNKRIIFIDCGLIYGISHSEVMIDKINAVSFVNGLILGEIHIEDGASTRIIENVLKRSTKPFVDAVHKAMELSQQDKQSISIQQTNVSVADEILKLKQLMDNGIISREEFEQQKRKLLR